MFYLIYTRMLLFGLSSAEPLPFNLGQHILGQICHQRWALAFCFCAGLYVGGPIIISASTPTTAQRSNHVCAWGIQCIILPLTHHLYYFGIAPNSYIFSFLFFTLYQREKSARLSTWWNYLQSPPSPSLRSFEVV